MSTYETGKLSVTDHRPRFCSADADYGHPLGFRLILEPFETDNATVPNPVFHLVCLDASLAIAPVFERFSSVVITSGTLSPLDMYPKMLGFDATVQESYVMTLSRDCFLPLVRPSLQSRLPQHTHRSLLQVVCRGADQTEISSRFEVRNDPAVVRNFGTLLVDYCKAVPDGIVAFFPSYLYMESIVSAWMEMVRPKGCCRPTVDESADSSALCRASSTRFSSTSLSSSRLQMHPRRVLHWTTTVGCVMVAIEVGQRYRADTGFAGMRQWPRRSASICRSWQGVGRN